MRDEAAPRLSMHKKKMICFICGHRATLRRRHVSHRHHRHRGIRHLRYGRAMSCGLCFRRHQSHRKDGCCYHRCGLRMKEWMSECSDGSHCD